MILVPLSISSNRYNLKKIILQAKIKFENFVQICALVRMVKFEKKIESSGIKLNFVNFGLLFLVGISPDGTV